MQRPVRLQQQPLRHLRFRVPDLKRLIEAPQPEVPRKRGAVQGLAEPIPEPDGRNRPDRAVGAT